MEAAVNPRPIRNFGGAPARIVIAGGGVGGLEALIAMRALAQERVTIDLIAPEREFVYRPLSVLEPFGVAATPRFRLTQIAMDHGARHHVDSVAEVDADRRRVRTVNGDELRYDALLISTGTRQLGGIRGAFTFGGPRGATELERLLIEATNGAFGRVVFAVPAGVGWTLPLYEVALNTAAYLANRAPSQVELTFVTPEDSPLGLFGNEASQAVRRLLDERNIELHAGTYPLAVDNGRLALLPGGHLQADLVVSLPLLKGRPVPGLSYDDDGYVAVDEHCLVGGTEDVYAVGDITQFPIKQGGIAVEQADVAAASIASRAGAPVTPRAFRPVLRGLLLTGGEPLYLAARITRGPAIESHADVEPLWWPPTKIPGRYLASYLAVRGKSVAAQATDRQESPVRDVGLATSRG
jgi:sulfide:quinone oxidoreductase